MSDITAVKKNKKDTHKIEQWAETKDAYVNQLYKRLRNNQKKLTKINEIEQKIRLKEIQANADQLESVSRKANLKAEMDEVLGYLKLYQEAFPDNPAFAVGAGKKKPAKTEAVAVEAPVVAAVPEESAVDANKIVDDALSFVADTIILSTLNGAQGVELQGSNQNLNDSLAYIRSAWTELTSGAGTWSAAKGHFVDVFSRLVFKSATQVGAHTRQSYSDLHSFITAFSASEGQALFLQERPVPVAHEDEYEEEKGAVEGGSPGEVKEGEVEGANGENWRGRGGRGARGGYRGGYQFRKHNTDEEGFTVVKDEEAHHSHYPSRRQQRGARGTFNRGRGEHRGGQPGAEHVEGGEHPQHTGEQQVAGEHREFRTEHRGGEFRGERRGGEFRGERRGGEFRGERRGGEFRGERRGGEFRGERRGGEFRGERRGGEFRGSRGGDRAWTEHKPQHRGRGEVRRSDGDTTAWGDAPATTAPVAQVPVATTAATETTAPQ
jgi:hypothetical protein